MSFDVTFPPSVRRNIWIYGGSVVKKLSTNAGDAGSIPELGRSPGKEMATHASILAWEIP